MNIIYISNIMRIYKCNACVYVYIHLVHVVALSLKRWTLQWICVHVR